MKETDKKDEFNLIRAVGNIQSRGMNMTTIGLLGQKRGNDAERSVGLPAFLINQEEYVA